MCHPLDCHSIVAKDVAGAVGRAIIARGEVVAQRGVPSCLPIDHQSRGNFVEFRVELFSEVCLTRVTTTVAFIAILDVANVTHFIDQSINCLVTDCFTTAHILFVIENEVGLITLVDELKHVIESIVLFDQFFDLVNSILVQDFFVVRGESDGHLLCLVDLFSIGSGVGSVATPCASSVTVQELVQRLAVLCLGLVDSGADLARVGRLRGGSVAGLLALAQDLLHVGVGLVHGRLVWLMLLVYRVRGASPPPLCHCLRCHMPIASTR